jgi:hypothetical protein
VNHAIFPIVVVCVSQDKNVAPPGFVETGFRGSHQDIVEMARDAVEF